jgi:YD repeat-containing protein
LLLDRILPTGALEHRDYDAGGRLLRVTRGYPNADPGFGDACRTKVSRGNAGMETIVQAEYNAQGLLTATVVDGVRREYVRDGLGRAIDTLIQTGFVEKKGLHGTVVRIARYRHLVREYDQFDRVAWEGVFDTPPPKYARPNAPAAGA